MKYFLSAGEASGDLHAAELMDALKNLDPQAEFTFLGGDKMAQVAGHKPVVDYRDMAYMGFVEVVRNLRKVLRNLSAAKEAMVEQRPDAVILVDYPSFNLRLAKVAKQQGIKVYYYISPKVWAWKEGRVKKIRRYVDRVLSILPFEKQWYAERHAMDVTYVGNPSVAEIDNFLKHYQQQDKTGTDAKQQRKVLALVPGSRRAEVLSNLPVMVEVARRHPEFHPVVAMAPGLPAELYEPWSDMELWEGKTFELMATAHAALVTSGTATLETALTATPQVVCYRNNGSRFAYWLFSKILKIKYVSLPNLIVDGAIIPEMLLHHCNADEVDAQLTPLLEDTPERRAQLNGYAQMRLELGTSSASTTAAQRIYNATHLTH